VKQHETKVVTDSRTLRAIAHPLRARLLTILRVDGPATATELGRRTGESSGSTSYHLRQLERYGYVEDAGPRAGRERRWQATSRDTSWEPADFANDPGGLAVSDALERRQVQLAVRQFEAWMRRRPDADPAWLRAATMADDILRLTPSQALAFFEDLLAVRKRYMNEPPAPMEGETAELVALYLQLLPFERIEDLEG
jgi:DNA-binding transcriptional ArsR family regulator